MKNTHMKFRFKAFGLHLACSAALLTLIVGSLYFGWYRWPGWYLAQASHAVAVMVAVDLVIGPLITLLIASPKKPMRELGRDISVIALIQLTALGYGSVTLWQGRPLYYAYSGDCLSVVQAFDIDADSLKTARAQKSALVPHWYSLPRWIYAPLPQDPQKSEKIVASAVMGGADVVAMPEFYRPWNAGLQDLHAQLKKPDDIRYFSRAEKARLKERMRASGLAIDEADALALTGRGRPVLAVVDPASHQIKAIIKAT